MSHTHPEGAPVGFEDQSHIGEKPDRTPREKCLEERDGHTPDGWHLDEEHHAFLVSTCEYCGISLLATGIDEGLMQETGEINVTEWVED